MIRSRQWGDFIFGFCALALVISVRVVAVVHWPDFSFPDEFWYTEIAQNLVDGHGYVMEGTGIQRFALCKAPALPFTLAVLGHFCELTPLVVKVVNELMNLSAVILFSGAVYLGTGRGTLGAGRWVPAIATLLLGGLHPAMIYMGATNYPQNGQALFTALLFFSMAYRKYRNPAAFNQRRWMVLDGFLIGVGGLFVPTQIYLLPGLWVFWLWHAVGLTKGRNVAMAVVRDADLTQRRGGAEAKLREGERLDDLFATKRNERAQKNSSSALFPSSSCGFLCSLWRFMRLSGRYAAWGFVGVWLAIGPWTVRNAIKEHAFIPFTATAGQQFYTGFNEQAGMNTGTQIDPSAVMLGELRAARTAKAFEAVHWKYSLDWVRANPRAAVNLYWLKAVNYFRWDNGSLNTTSAAGGAGLVWVQRLTTLGVFGIFVLGGVGRWALDFRGNHMPDAQCPAPNARESVWFWTLAVFLLVSALGHGFFITRYRYRIPFEPMLLAVGVMGMFSGIRHRASGAGR